VELAPGGSSWSAISDRNSKENFASVEGRDILEHLSNIPIETWNYRPRIHPSGTLAQWPRISTLLLR
jgi:hypothetical protein